MTELPVIADEKAAHQFRSWDPTARLSLEAGGLQIMKLLSAGGRRRALGLLLATIASLRAFATEPAGIPLEFTNSALETALLPLSIATAAIPGDLGIRAGEGGGIAIVDDKIVGVDLTGNFFAVENAAARALALPPIENHAGDYARYA